MIGCEREEEAGRGRAVRENRLGRLGLPLHPAQTRLWPCGRPSTTPQSGQGPASLDVLGLTCSWRRPRTGHWRLGCKTRRASLRRAQQALDDWCRRHRHQPVKAQHAARGRRVRGHGHAVGVHGHFPSLWRRVAAPKRAWDTWVCRRRQRQRLTGERLTELLRPMPRPCPRLTVRIWGVEPRGTSTEEPDGGNLLVRLWRGAGVGNLPAYSTKHFCAAPQEHPSAPCRRPHRATVPPACPAPVEEGGQGYPGAKAVGRAVGDTPGARDAD